MPQVIRGKDRSPATIGYNSIIPLTCVNANGAAFVTGGTGGGPVSNNAFAPIAFNTKIIAVAYTAFAENGPSGVLPFNVVSGATQSYGSAAVSSYQYADLGGTFVDGDTVSVSVAGLSVSYKVSAIDVAEPTQALQKITANFVDAMNLNPAFRALYRANSLAAEFVVQTLSYSTATPAFSVSKVSAAGTIVAGGATMNAGVTGALPPQPALDQSNAGAGAKIPSPTAVAGTTLFPVDIILPTFFADIQNVPYSGVIYCYENMDAIFPAASAVTAYNNLVYVSNQNIMVPVLYSVPVDNNPTSPMSRLLAFYPSQSNL